MKHVIYTTDGADFKSGVRVFIFRLVFELFKKNCWGQVVNNGHTLNVYNS